MAIENDLQLGVTLGEIDRFKKAIKDYDWLKALERGADPVICDAHFRSMEHMLARLEKQVSDYQALRAQGGEDCDLAALLSEAVSLSVEAEEVDRHMAAAHGASKGKCASAAFAVQDEYESRLRNWQSRARAALSLRP